MTYQDEATKIADETTAQVLAAVALYEAGALTVDALVSVVASYIAAGKSAGAGLGDLSLAAAVTLQTGQPSPPIGATIPAGEVERLERAATTLVKDESASVARWERLAEAEVRTAVADAYAEALKESDLVTGWVRGLEPEACQLCIWWWRNGRVWPDDHDMPRHKGCDCSQLIVTTSEPIREVQQ